MSLKKEIIVVTGASGCLGQHIVKLLQEKDDGVEEIRVFDKKPYLNNLGHAENKQMRHFVADVSDVNSVSEALCGATCVIHTACVIDVSLFPNVEDMITTNIEGTKNIINACMKQNVPNLVFTSTTDMVCGTEHIFYGTESTTPIPTKFMIGKYAETKYLSEKLVLEANGNLLSNGETLKTVSIRPTPFYGEEDKHFFYSVLQSIKKQNGYYRRIRSLDERLQITYVGNAAWAHLKAKDKLVVDKTICGEAFFITDDTPIIDIHEHLQPYIESRGFKISDYIYPYWFAWLCLSLLGIMINLLNIFVNFKVDIPPVSVLNYMCSTFFYNRSKATLRLDYQPIYAPDIAKECSLKYYSKIPL